MRKFTFFAVLGLLLVSGLTFGAAKVERVKNSLKVLGALTVTGDATVSGAIYSPKSVSGPRLVVTTASGVVGLSAAQTGAVVVNTGTTGTTNFILPGAAAGLNFCFVEGGDAGGELLVSLDGASIVGKTDGSETGTGIATAASTGIKNTAATNVKGDHVCLTAINATTWVMTSVGGIWASQ